MGVVFELFLAAVGATNVDGTSFKAIEGVENVPGRDFVRIQEFNEACLEEDDGERSVVVHEDRQHGDHDLDYAGLVATCGNDSLSFEANKVGGGHNNHSLVRQGEIATLVGSVDDGVHLTGDVDMGAEHDVWSIFTAFSGRKFNHERTIAELAHIGLQDTEFVELAIEQIDELGLIFTVRKLGGFVRLGFDAAGGGECVVDEADQNVRGILHWSSVGSG